MIFHSRDASTHPRAGVALVIGVFVLLAGLYSIVVPPFETPDEIWHYAFIQHLASGKGLPVSQPNTPALWRQQGVQAPGYYLAAAALTAAISQDDFPAIYGRANPHAAIGQPDATTNRNYLIHHADEGWPWRGSILALHLARFFSVLSGRGDALGHVPGPGADHGPALGAPRDGAGRLHPAVRLHQRGRQQRQCH